MPSIIIAINPFAAPIVEATVFTGPGIGIPVITKISIKTYGSTEKVREICELNNLSVNDLIYPGQKILLP